MMNAKETIFINDIFIDHTKPKQNYRFNSKEIFFQKTKVYIKKNSKLKNNL